MEKGLEKIRNDRYNKAENGIDNSVPACAGGGMG